MVKGILKGLFGGGSSIVYVAFAGIALGGWFHYQDVKADRDRYEQERDAAVAQSLAKDQTIASQARTGARRAEANAEQSQAEEAIHAVPDTIHCAASEPVVVALDVLRKRARDAAADHPDQ